MHHKDQSYKILNNPKLIEQFPNIPKSEMWKHTLSFTCKTLESMKDPSF